LQFLSGPARVDPMAIFRGFFDFLHFLHFLPTPSLDLPRSRPWDATRGTSEDFGAQQAQEGRDRHCPKMGGVNAFVNNLGSSSII
jgi:hypothetical protein